MSAALWELGNGSAGLEGAEGAVRTVLRTFLGVLAVSSFKGLKRHKSSGWERGKVPSLSAKCRDL